MTVKAQVAVLLAPSVALKVFVVTPTGKLAPEAKPDVWMVVTIGQLSVPTGAIYVTIALHWPVVLLTATLDGQVITGSVLSVQSAGTVVTAIDSGLLMALF